MRGGYVGSDWRLHRGSIGSEAVVQTTRNILSDLKKTINLFVTGIAQTVYTYFAMNFCNVYINK